MEHVAILGYIIILMVGSWTAFSTHQIHRRFDPPFLKSLFYYVVVFNLSVFLYLVGTYAWTNLVKSEPSIAEPSVEVILLVSILATEIALAYTIVRVAVELRGKVVLPTINRAFISATVLFTMGYVVGWNLDTDSPWLAAANQTVVYGGKAVIVSALAVLAVEKFADFAPDRRKSIRGFAYLMLSGYLPFVATWLLPHPYLSFGAAVTRLWLNIVPLVWIRSFFLPLHATLPTTSEGIVLDKLALEYGISKREREVMALIVEGKTNKEIEEQLFISFNTVKNHIYNLYQKLGVKSRGQLMHMVMKSNHAPSEPAEKR